MAPTSKRLEPSQHPGAIHTVLRRRSLRGCAVDSCKDEQNNWLFLKQNGFEFTPEEFKQTQALIYGEFAITPR